MNFKYTVKNVSFSFITSNKIFQFSLFKQNWWNIKKNPNENSVYMLNRKYFTMDLKKKKMNKNEKGK